MPLVGYHPCTLLCYDPPGMMMIGYDNDVDECRTRPAIRQATNAQSPWRTKPRRIRHQATPGSLDAASGGHSGLPPATTNAKNRSWSKKCQKDAINANCLVSHFTFHVSLLTFHGGSPLLNFDALSFSQSVTETTETRQKLPLSQRDRPSQPEMIMGPTPAQPGFRRETFRLRSRTKNPI